jgi:hypothetical protein
VGGQGREAKTGDGAPGAWPELRAWLKANPQHLLSDHELLNEVGLKPADNVVAFGPAALSRLEAAIKRESGARRAVEHVARANFSAQAQTHVTVLDLLESRNHTDLATRLDHACQARFGLAAASICLERPGPAPFGWRLLEPDSVVRLLGEHGLQRLGPSDHQGALFGARGAEVHSMALVRMALWSGQRDALVAFGSPDPEGFTADMGAELIAFVTRVVERIADRWPVLDPGA